MGLKALLNARMATSTINTLNISSHGDNGTAYDLAKIFDHPEAVESGWLFECQNVKMSKCQILDSILSPRRKLASILTVLRRLIR